MTHQPSFAHAEFAAKKKTTRREKFLTRMEAVIPWAKLLAVIEPFYPKGKRGRPPLGLERMLRVYFLQQWYGLKSLAEGAEKEALKAAEKIKASVRAFVEHPFHIVKNLFRYRKVRYRGLAKNGHQLYVLFGLANVMIGARSATA